MAIPSSRPPSGAPDPAPTSASPPPRLAFVAADAPATRAVGAALGRCLPPGALVTLSGGLGAGKTTFAQGIAQGLGVVERVVSPTYTIERTYGLPVAGEAAPPAAPDGAPAASLASGSAPPRLVHVDLYRVGSAVEALELGLEERLADGDRVVVEWPSHARGGLAPADVAVSLAIAVRTASPPTPPEADAPRRIDVAAGTAAGAAVLACLAAALDGAGDAP